MPRPEVDLAEIVADLDAELAIDAVPDASVNGLQLQARRTIGRVGVAVDASLETIEAAALAECDLLIVHHGLLWGATAALTGDLGARVGRCFAAGLSVYAAHLPLDLHRTLGNNVLLAERLGARPTASFGRFDGVDIGWLTELPEPESLAVVAARLAGAGCDEQLQWCFGPDPVRRLAVMTGSGCSALAEAIAAGADCFISGEPRHSAYHEAREAGINCLFGGHYATETFGVRALGERLRERWGLEVNWLDFPTGV